MKSMRLAALSITALLMCGTALSQPPPPCETLVYNGLGQPTCIDPSPTRAEGALWVAGEQAISIVAAAVDAYGCFDFNNPVNLTIGAFMTGGATVNPHARAQATLGTAKFAVEEGAYLAAGVDGVQRGLRLFLSTLDPLGLPDTDTWTTQGQVGPGGLYQLNGRFNTDATFSVMHGNAHFSWGGDSLDEHIIKDFYLGHPVEPVFTGCSFGTTLLDAQNTIGLDAAREEFLSVTATCDLANPTATDYDPNNPFTAAPPYVAYDNGLEVTTKKYAAPDLLTSADDTQPSLFEGSPIGKWRQVSRYRRPNGGNGRLNYSKVRIAPYGVPTCAIVLDGTVTGNASNLAGTFNGTISIYNLEQTIPFYGSPPELADIETTALAYTENDPATVITASITVADIDDVNLESATIQITGNYQNGQDLLAVAGALPAGIGTTGFNPASGTIELTGSATLADYQTALRAVTYQNTSDNPSTLLRTVSFTVNDGELGSNTQTRDITITPVNDPPVLANIEATPLAYIENDPAAAITAAITVTDVDDTNLESATIQITANYQNGEDLLADDGSVPAGITVAAFNAGSGTLTLSGTASVADYQTALRAITYENTSDNPSSLTRTVSFTVNDGDANSNTQTRDIDVTPANDPPTATNLTQTKTYTEGDASVALDDIVVSDVDISPVQTITATLTLANIAAGALTAASGNGETYTPGTGIWTVTGTLATVNAALAAVSFTPATNNDADTTINTHVEDQDSAGPADGTITLDVTPVIDAPTATNLTQNKAYTEDDPTVALDDIVVSDVDTDPAQTITATLTLANTAAGELTAASGNGETYTPGTGIWTVTGTLAAVNAALADVSFTPATNHDVDTTINTHVEDQEPSGPADGLITLDVTPVNDPPTATNLTQTKTYTEGDATVALDDIVVSEVDTDPAQTITATLTLANTEAGVLSAASGNGETYTPGTGVWTVTGTLATVNAALAAVSFTPATDNDVDTTINTHVEDQGTVGPADGAVTLEVTPVNDAPVVDLDPDNSGTNQPNFDAGTFAVTVGTPVLLTDVDASITDADTGAMITSLTASISGGLLDGASEVLAATASGGADTVTPGVNSVVITASGSTAALSDFQTVLRSITYDNNAGTPTDGTRTISILANDGTANSATVTATIEVVSAPTLDLDGDNSSTALGNDFKGAFTEDGGPVAAADTDVVIVSPTPNLDKATATLTNRPDGAFEVLAATASGGITAGDISYTPATGILLIDPATAQPFADFQAVLASLKYNNTDDNPDTANRIITVTVTDSNSATSAAATSTITVAAVNDPPVAVNDTYSDLPVNVLLDAGGVTASGVEVNDADGVLSKGTDDSDPEGDTLSVTKIQATTIPGGGSASATTDGGGTVTMYSDGTFTYVSELGETATSDTFTYTLSDGSLTDTATVTINLGDSIWFIDDDATGGANNGRSSTPFQSVGAFNGATTGTGDTVFVHATTGPITDDGIDLQNSQTLVGERSGLTSGNLVIPAGSAPELAPASGNAINLGSGNTVSGLDIGSTGGTGIFGSDVGALTVSDVGISGTGGGVDIASTTGSTIGVTLNSLSASSSTDEGIRLNNVNGTFTVTGTTGTIATTGVPAIDIDGGATSLTVNATFASVGTTGGGNGILLKDIAAGTFTTNGGSISGVTSRGVDLDNVDTTVNIGSSISNTGGRTVEATGSAGTVSFSAAIDDNGSGINLNSNTGGSFTFSGGLTLDTGSNTAFSATAGGTVAVTGTTNTVGTTATRITGTAVHIDSTDIGALGVTFKSLDVGGGAKGIILNSTGTTGGGFTVTGTGTTDGSGGTITAVSQRGADINTAQNVTLKNMNFTMTTAMTNGADPTNASSTCGGLLLGGNLGCNAAIHLVSTKNVVLDNLDVTDSPQQGINGNNVDGLTLTNLNVLRNGNETREDGLRVRDLKGTVSISGTLFDANESDQVHIVNSSVALTSFTMSGSRLQDSQAPNGANGIKFEFVGSATAPSVVLDGNFFSDLRSDGFLFDATDTAAASIELVNNTMDDSHGSGRNNGIGQITSDLSADVTFNVHDNPKFESERKGLVINQLTASTTGGTLIGRVEDNPDMHLFGVGPTLVSDSSVIDVKQNGAGTVTVLIDTNTIVNDGFENAIGGIAREDLTNNGTLNMTVNNNTVSTTNAANGTDGIGITRGTSAGTDTNKVCADITDNTASSSGRDAIRVRQFEPTTFQIKGLTGSGTSATNVESFLAGVNPATTALDINALLVTAGFVTAATCPTPP